MQLTRIRVAIFGLLAIAACSSGTTFPVDSFGGSGSVGGVARPSEDFGSTSSGAPSMEPRCPADAPKENAGCTVPGAVCAYGPDVREDCNETFECEGGRWLHSTPNCATDCPKTIDGIKPDTACPDSRVACSYDDGTCGCFTDEVPTPPPLNDGGATDAGDGGKDGGKTYVPIPGQWKCVAPPTTVACPSARPRVLDGCVKRVTCDYGSCELGRALSYSCESGFWNEPTSTYCQ